MKLIFWLMLADGSCVGARQRNIASGSTIHPPLPPSVILDYDFQWEEPKSMAPPPFLRSTIDYRVLQIADSIRPTKPITTLHIFHFLCQINL